jgi:outer membrane protein TolC
MDLAREIYTKSNLKYKEGVGSSLEVVQAENDLKTAQANYLNAIYDLVISKIDLKKANGTEITQP